MTESPTMTAVDAVRDLPARIEGLLDDLHQSAVPGVGERADDLVRSVVGLYGAGLERIMEILDSHPDAERLIRALADDDVVGNLLLLHDLHPDSVDSRIVAALDKVRPYLGSHAGGIDYLGVDDDGIAQLQLAGSCDGCPSSSVTVQLTIERALLEAAPELDGVHVEGMVEAKKVAPLLQIGHRPSDPAPAAAPIPDHWSRVLPTAVAGQSQRLDADGVGVLICNLDDSYVAYPIGCPRCGSELHTATLTGTALQCLTCGTGYDVRHAGCAVDGGMGLTPLPLLADSDGDGWRLAVPELVVR
ncbi:MAG TPA: NifU family protein [Jatrophihabitans sp.]|jgi:Fe-S cluster biogenesis protein NfuA